MAELAAALLLYAMLAPISAVWFYIGSSVGSSDPLAGWEVVFAMAVGVAVVGIPAYFTFRWWQAGRRQVWITPLMMIPIVVWWPFALALLFKAPRRWFTRQTTPSE